MIRMTYASKEIHTRPFLLLFVVTATVIMVMMSQLPFKQDRPTVNGLLVLGPSLHVAVLS